MRTRARDSVVDIEVPVMAVVIVVSSVALALGLVNLISNGTGSPISARADAITISTTSTGRPIPGGFLGLSLEFTAIKPYAGTNPASINPVFVQLIRNLTPGQQPVLRIGGDSADRTWWPLPGIARPPGVSYSLDAQWLQVARALVRALRARVILGLNLEADNPDLAAGEARALIGGSEPGSVLALELGNEPELYSEFPWYRTASGRGVTGRPAGYDFTEFLNDFTRFSAVLPAAALGGPTTGGSRWIFNLGQFLTAQPKVTLVTLHRYPLQLCFTGRRSPHFPTIRHLLSPTASTGLAASFAPEVALAHAHGRMLRVDELNSVSCGADRAVSRTFASALWALDTLFEMAQVGVDAVNIHTFPGAGYELFSFSVVNGRWRASVAPEYYGLMMFAAAAPPGSRLLATSGRTRRSLKVWATRAPDGRIRVVVINKDSAHPRLVAVHAPTLSGAATLDRLQAPAIASPSGVTLGGQSFGSQTESGRLQGTSDVSSVKPSGGAYSVEVPAASAALITLPRGA